MPIRFLQSMIFISQNRWEINKQHAYLGRHPQWHPQLTQETMQSHHLNRACIYLRSFNQDQGKESKWLEIEFQSSERKLQFMESGRLTYCEELIASVGPWAPLPLESTWPSRSCFFCKPYDSSHSPLICLKKNVFKISISANVIHLTFLFKILP